MKQTSNAALACIVVASSLSYTACQNKAELQDVATANTNTYYMKLAIDPPAIVPGRQVTLSLTPAIKGAENKEVSLEVGHEKKIHLILVNEDLSWFDHIHPEYQSDRSYKVNAVFPAAGNYTLFADYKPAGSDPVVDKLKVNIPGTAPATTTYHTDKLSAFAGDGFSVTLGPADGKFFSGKPMSIPATVKLNGEDIDPATFQNYLGAKAHMVIIGYDDKEYVHVHPSVKDGKFDLHTTFEKPGIYRGWIQFQSNNKVYTADFVMNVKEATTADGQHTGKAHGHSAHEHAAH